MADLNLKPVLSVCATKGNRLSDLVIKNGQLIFVQDRHRIAFDFNDKRVFYNQIEEVATEEERRTLTPENGLFYFVIDTAVLWRYQDKWIQITTPPKEVVFIGAELPELGTNKTLFIDTVKKEISIWDDDTSAYIVVADKTNEISLADIDAMFIR